MYDTAGGPPARHLDPPEENSLFSRRLSRAQLIGLDVLAVLGFTLTLIGFGAGGPDPTGFGAVVPLWVTGGFAVAMGLPLAVRRLWPRTVLLIVLTASIGSLFVNMPRDSFAATGFALYLVALSAKPRRWIPTTTIAVVTAIGVLCLSMAGINLPHQAVGTVLIGMVVLGGSWTFGRAVRDRRAAASRAAGRRAERLVAEERLHIARELHDVVAHSMSLIAVKSSVANHVAAKRPDEALHALRVIEATSKSSLIEMRRILGVLRSDDDTAADLAPAPDLSRLPLLVDSAAMAGVRVRIRRQGLENLPADIGLSAYRIIQEAVTNVVKHAAPADCEVGVIAGDGWLRIDVTDNGPGCRVLPANPAGHGLIGMAERVAMYDGELTAGPHPQGGFAVSAVIPLHGGDTSEGLDGNA